MFKNILVPIDLAHIEKSQTMIEQAKVLADANDSQLTLLNVIMEIPAYVALEMPAGTQEKGIIHAKNTLNKLAQDHALPKSTGIEVVLGNAANKILDIAEKKNIDLIMIASHQPGFADYLLGSVSSKVVRHAHCTVMVLR